MTFKKFIYRILACSNQSEMIEKVFYGETGIDMAYQRGKISWKEHQTLLALIERMA